RSSSVSLRSSACFFFSSRRRHTRFSRDWSSDVCSSDLPKIPDHLIDKAAVAGILPQLYPLPAWETIYPGDIFRVFERGGRNISKIGRASCRGKSGDLRGRATGRVEQEEGGEERDGGG